MILTSLLSAALLGAQSAPLEISPSDDVWVYPHSGRPDEDPFLRVWGGGDYAVGVPSPGSFDFSYSLLKFALPADLGTPKKAVLVVTQVADPAYTGDDFTKAPLEARLAPDGWNENTWEFAQAMKAVPGAKDEAILGKAVRGEVLDGKPVVMEIDLLAGPAKITWGKSLALALTSKMDPESMGEGRMYKLYSRNAPDAKLRPILKIWK